MKILIVCSGNYEEVERDFSIRRPFIYDQVEALKPYIEKCDIFFIKGKGVFGYLKNVFKLREKLSCNKYDLIHAHYGLSGVITCLAALLKKIPVITTFHGTDITHKKKFIFSIIAILLSDKRVFVSNKLIEKSQYFLFKKNYYEIPCGVDLSLFQPRSRVEASKKLNINPYQRRILFSSAFQNSVKNFGLAQKAVEKLNLNYEILEIKNRSREEVSYLLNASDVLLMTSFTEGSPQIIKEAMASNCPIISTDVGDVRKILGKTKNCYLVEFDENEITQKLEDLLKYPRRSNGRDFISSYSNTYIADKLLKVYKSVN
ncbi:glycosyltransferase family 4 protein [uncultured Christiangramia sp.]|uniref:glycosyltransferase family 4 protein n=1 Tax=uncultured Christiangramia sp. TaxID=503836 RepID=UPI00261C5522|nr:glycosyltransferase family 4 protein [uncultured Christiangramia sp.]